MELTRRDALAVLGGAVTVGAGGATLTWRSLDEGADDGLDEAEVATLEAVAEVLYPSDVSGIPAFLETYVVGRVGDRPDRLAGLSEALAAVDDRARAWYDAPFRHLSREDRDAVLRGMGLDFRDADPEGVLEARVRYYLVDELLYAFYATPTGAELVGLPNPQGYPGGLDSYQRGPDDG
ncbi:MAG: gluconate 2-dehydrogenase subunit 3 family protein [Haloarculaceae archaeon]